MTNTRVNSDIISNRILLIGEDGNKIGVFLIKDALLKAREAGLDLIQVSSDQDIPVCKLGDYGKIQYEMKKKKKDSQTSKIVTKEIRLGPTTGENDVNVRIKAANKFLSKGNHVKFSINVKGRANAHKDLVLEKLTDILNKVDGRVEIAPSFNGNICSALVVPE